MSSRNKIIKRYAYQYIGPFFEPRLKNYEELKRTLRKAGIDVSLRMYLSETVFMAIVGFLISFVIFLILSLAIGLPVAFIPIVSILTAFSVYVFRLIKPSYDISERKRYMEAGLPTAASYMAAMSSAGVTPDEIFYSLSSDEIALSITDDSKKIARDIKIFGLDIIRAIDNASKRSPSSKYSSFLEGINATNTSGGDLQGYFENASKTLMKDKLQDEKGYIEFLGLIAELFLVACIVMPTFAVVLIAMMALRGTMAHTDLMVFILGLTFGLIPILQAVIILMVDGSQPLE
ncbi:MAG: type II secretion system F family protein [Candidatus Heimdallarchaeota archaeon]|nr:type II secretion system F family protein [Candidatus Heimdallarchaeota archaeon]